MSYLSKISLYGILYPELCYNEDMEKIVFVCLGNICRSPMAEFVMKDLVEKEGENFEVESRATSSWEHGNPIHPGTRALLTAYGIPFDATKEASRFHKRISIF